MMDTRIPMMRDQALRAFEAALSEAPVAGLRDLHEALQTLHFAIPEGKASLIRGAWGSLGGETSQEQYTGCPLNALFIREARAMGGDLRSAIELSRVRMGRHGFAPSDFYGAWDAGVLSCVELRDRVERHLTERLQAHRSSSG